MFKKSYALIGLVCAVLCQSQSLQAFTVMNQTDSKMVLIIEESKFTNEPGGGRSIASLGSKPHKIKIGPKEIKTFDLKKECPALLVGIEKTVVKGNKTTTTTDTTCCEGYPYDDEKDILITNDWGLVIHKPIENPDLGDRFSPNYFMNKMRWQLTVDQGYGIKCLHPKLLELVTTLDALPDVFQ